MKWKSVLHDLLVQFYFVRVVGDDIQLSEPLVVDERRRANLRAILNIPVAIDVSDRLPVPRIAEQFNRVGDDSFVGVGVADMVIMNTNTTRQKILPKTYTPLIIHYHYFVSTAAVSVQTGIAFMN